MDFLAEFRKLAGSSPRLAIHSRSVENCDFTDYAYVSKNSYVSFFITEAHDCYYSEYLYKARDCVDCMYLTSCELCYECIDCSNLYDCSFLNDCHSCSNVDFSIDCINCKDCYGCYGLRQKQYCIFNKTHCESEYRKKVRELKKNSSHATLKILAPEFAKHPRLFARQLKGGERCIGDYIYFSKNCFQCFNVRNASSSAYVTDSMEGVSEIHNSYDCSFCLGIESCYECDRVSASLNCMSSSECNNCADCAYCLQCSHLQDCFGCFNLQNKTFCILNRQFSPTEYKAAIKGLTVDLKQKGLYGKPLADLLA